MNVATHMNVAECYKTHAARVYRWAHGFCGCHAEAADVVQDVFSRAVRKPPLLASGYAAIGWLRRATESVIIDRWRAAEARPRLVREDGANAPADHVTDATTAMTPEARAAIRSALLHLSEQQRLVLMAKFYEGLTFAEIAAELGVSVSTAKTHYIRALETLRPCLRPIIAQEFAR